MYEVYAGSVPYAGVPAASTTRLMKAVLQGLRPQLPASTPPAYRALAEACWSADLTQRPSFDAILQQLQVSEWSGCGLWGGLG